MEESVSRYYFRSNFKAVLSKLSPRVSRFFRHQIADSLHPTIKSLPLSNFTTLLFSFPAFFLSRFPTCADKTFPLFRTFFSRDHRTAHSKPCFLLTHCSAQPYLRFPAPSHRRTPATSYSFTPDPLTIAFYSCDARTHFPKSESNPKHSNF